MTDRWLMVITLNLATAERTMLIRMTLPQYLVFFTIGFFGALYPLGTLVGFPLAIVYRLMMMSHIDPMMSGDRWAIASMLIP